MRLFETVLQMSASASITIAAVLVLRLLLRRMPRGVIWILWLAVLARLWCPVFPTVRLGVPLPAADPAAVVSQLLPEPAAPEIPVQQQMPIQTQTPAEPAAEPVELLPLVWAVGAASMAAWGLISDLRLRNRLRTAVRREDGVYLADGIDTPFVRGLVFPKIYLPSELDGVGERYILLHERRHIRNFDPIVKLLFFGALCVHWFNPLVWLACALAERDMELRCDEGVLGGLEEAERMDYASALVACASRRRELLPLAFGEGDTKRRVKNVLNYKKPKWWAVILAAILCVAAAGCMLVDPEPAYDPARLEYPGLPWGASMDEALKALGKTEKDIVVDSEVEQDGFLEYAIGLSDVEAFGQKTSLVVLYFRDYTESGEPYELTELRLYYPDGYDGSETADMAALEAELERIYGPAGQTQHWDAETRSYMDVTQDSPANVFVWDSALTSWDCMTQQQREGLQRYYSVWRGRTLTMEETEQECLDPAFRIRLQPYYHQYLAQVGHDMTEENRSMGLTNICINMDALRWITSRQQAEFALKSE